MCGLLLASTQTHNVAMAPMRNKQCVTSCFWRSLWHMLLNPPRSDALKAKGVTNRQEMWAAIGMPSQVASMKVLC